jgi:hypothetical protein
VKLKGIVSVLTIKYIDIMEKDIYIEYSNYDFEYMSFSKAKKTILKKLPKSIAYVCNDTTKSIDFLNSILHKYKMVDNTLILKHFSQLSQKQH